MSAAALPHPPSRETTATSAGTRSAPARSALRQPLFMHGLGKYREILIAVAFFLVFDLGVLVLNFVISYQIADDAVSINLAGRQRMLSQRMTKATMALQDDLARGAPVQATRNELDLVVKLFDSTLNGFAQGGKVQGGEGQPVTLKAAPEGEPRRIVLAAQRQWDPIRRQLDGLLTAQAPSLETAQATATFMREQNLALLKSMNDLTTALESTANAKADSLRMIQTGGITLALLNFAFILFKFIRKLREQDAKVEAAQQETSEIFATVREGLFLLDRNLRVGSQRSASLTAILGREVAEGQSFVDLLREMLPAQEFENAREYIDLLFSGRVKESLIGSLNPLTEVQLVGRQDGAPTKHVSMQFNRVVVGGELSHLLVTVTDISDRVRLAREVETAKLRARDEMELLLSVLKVEPQALQAFLARADASLHAANDALRGAEGTVTQYRAIVNDVFRRVHTIKGDAALLGLTAIEAQAHAFETELVVVRGAATISGKDLIGLSVSLDECLQRVADIGSIGRRMSDYVAGSSAGGAAVPAATPAAIDQAAPATIDPAALDAQLNALVSRLSRDHGKDVELRLSLAPIAELEPAQGLALKDALVQLLRNAMVHGIEPPKARLARQKPERGLIDIALEREGAGWQLRVRDDGAGIQTGSIRRALLAAGKHTADEVKQMDSRTLISKIFEPGFSTATGSHRDAGRGVGLDAVKAALDRIGARLHLSTRAHEYTQFTVVMGG